MFLNTAIQDTITPLYFKRMPLTQIGADTWSRGIDQCQALLPWLYFTIVTTSFRGDEFVSLLLTTKQCVH